jgi:small-conductance mechanosensitive channel
LIIVALVALQITGVVAQAWAIISATIAALAVGFVASWSLLSNVTSALILLAFRPFRVDDEVEVLDGDTPVVKGRVADLNLMFTTIVDGDVACRVPNNLFLQKIVRVTREGVAPDPSDDTSAPFF